VSIDFFTVPTIAMKVLFVFILLQHGRRKVLHFNVTEHPTAVWTVKGGVKVSHRGGGKGDRFLSFGDRFPSEFGGGWSAALRRPQGGAFRAERKPPPNSVAVVVASSRAIASRGLFSSGCF
jgi:hypothetical protein